MRMTSWPVMVLVLVGCVSGCLADESAGSIPVLSVPNIPIPAESFQASGSRAAGASVISHPAQSRSAPIAHVMANPAFPDDEGAHKGSRHVGSYMLIE